MDKYAEPILFSFREIPRLIPNIKAPRIQYIIKTGVLKPFFSPTGRGSNRTYDHGDIFLIATYNYLIDHGIDLKMYAQAIKDKENEFIRKLETAREDDVLLLSGKEMNFEQLKNIKIKFDKKNFLPQVIIPIGLLIKDVDERINQLLSEDKKGESNA